MTQLEFPFMAEGRLLAIDPDTKVFGWAFFSRKRLVCTRVATVAEGLPPLPEGVVIVCEKPEDRPGSPARKRDIIELALAAGKIVGNRPCTFRVPSEWKGQIPKEVHWARMRERMDVGELGILEVALAGTKKGSHPEILDAVALGMTQLERL